VDWVNFSRNSSDFFLLSERKLFQPSIFIECVILSRFDYPAFQHAKYLLSMVLQCANNREFKARLLHHFSAQPRNTSTIQVANDRLAAVSVITSACEERLRKRWVASCITINLQV
jgi:hypothetical protein